MSKAFENLAKDLIKCSECEEWFTTDTKLRSHLNRHHNMSVRRSERHLIRCSVAGCEQRFKLESSLFEHMKNCHQTEDYLLECPVCCHRYNCRTRYEKHVKSHETTNRFYCQQCDHSFHKAVGLEVHVNRDHRNGGKPFVCDICGQNFYANEKLLNHLSNKHKMAVFGCGSCKYMSNSKYKMSRHQLIHSADRYKCDIVGCRYGFDSKYNLTIHKKNKHSIGSRFRPNSDNDKSNGHTSKAGTDINRNTFQKTAYLKNNLKCADKEGHVIDVEDSSTEADDSSDKCDENQSINPILPEIVRQNYTNSKNFSIIYNKNKNSVLINQNCGKTTVRTFENLTHKRTTIEVVEDEEMAEDEKVVENEEVVEEQEVAEDEEVAEEEEADEDEEESGQQKYCTFSECQAFFTNGKAFRDHILAVHKLVKCNKCEKCFQSFSGLYKHKRRYHRSQRQIVCRFCNDKFFYQTSYAKHMETHGEDRRSVKWRQNVMKTYSCYECKESFVEKDKYLKHLSKSHSIPAFECDLCKYKSMNKKLLASHMVRHSTVKPFRCEISGCGLTFKSKNSLQIHKRVKHLNHSQSFVCEWPECGKQFRIKQLYDYHQSVHTQNTHELNDCEIKPNHLKCLIIGCNQVFNEKFQLNQHMSDKHDLTIEPIPSTDHSIQSSNHSTDCRFVSEMIDLVDIPNDSTQEWTDNYDSDINQSFVESNIISIDDQNYEYNSDHIKQESIGENSDDMIITRININKGLDSMNSNCDFNLITHLMRKRYKSVDYDRGYDRCDAQSAGYSDQNNSDSQSNGPNRSQNLLCFECDLTFSSYDLLYRHNNEFHNKYKPKYK